MHRAPGDFPSGTTGDVLTVAFTVMGIPCLGLNGGPEFQPNEAFSFQVATVDQAETDRYWNAIVGNGGQESACGWCKDRWGVRISPGGVGVVGIRLLPDVHLQRGDTPAFHVAPAPRSSSMQPEAFAFLREFVRQVVEEVRLDRPAQDGPRGRPFATCHTALTKQQARAGVAVYRIDAP